MKIIQRMNAIEEKLFDDEIFLETLKQITHLKTPTTKEVLYDVAADIEDAIANVFEENFPGVEDDIDFEFFVAKQLTDKIRDDERGQFENYSPFGVVQEYFMIMMMNVQDNCIADLDMNDERVKMWRMNATYSPLSANKSSTLPKTDPLYYYQPIMLDLKQDVTKLMDKVIKKSIQINPHGVSKNIEHYLSYGHFFNKYSRDLERETKAYEKVMSIYNEIIKEEQEIDKFLNKYGSTPLSRMNDDVLYCFLSPMFDSLDRNSKAEILDEVMYRETKDLGIDIELKFDLNKDFNLYKGLIETFNNTVVTVPDFFIEAVAKENEDLADDLSINFYRNEKGKFLNFLNLNSVEGQIQPAALYFKSFQNKVKNKVVNGLKNNFKEAKFVEQMDIYGTLSMESIAEKIKYYHNMELKEFQNKLMSKMRNNIEKDINKYLKEDSIDAREGR